MAEKNSETKEMIVLRFKKIHKSELMGMLSSGKVDKFLIPQEEAGKFYFIDYSKEKALAYEIKGTIIFKPWDASEEKNCVYVREDTNHGEVIDLLMDEEKAAKF